MYYKFDISMTFTSDQSIVHITLVCMPYQSGIYILGVCYPGVRTNREHTWSKKTFFN